MMWPSRKSWRRRIAFRLDTFEAIAYVLAAQCALKVFPFQRLTWFFERRAKQPELTGEARRQSREEVRKAIVRVWFHSPIHTTCLHRAIAAQAMLRRRGVSTTLYYGAATLPERGLTAHAWVQDDKEGVMGHLTAQRDQYHVLARYPGSQA
jgi:hypothetical protein